MLINYNAQISKISLNYKIMCVNKINCISRDHRNNEDDIKFNIEHRIYKRFNSELINLKQVFRSDIIVFDKYKVSADFHKSEL